MLFRSGNVDLRAMGRGTQRVVESLQAMFPDAKVVRIDRDSARRRGELERTLAQVGRGEGDILVGTQLLAKGHDFPNLTLVCVLNADSALLSTDYRSAERLFATLAQQSGGRFDMGVGRGDSSRRILGKKPLNMETMAEFCSAVKGMIRGDTVHYDDEGKDVQLPWADGYEMPVWVAAYGPKALKAAGYKFTGGWSWDENIGWSGTTGTPGLNDLTRSIHDGLFRSPPHRVNLMNDGFDDVGLGVRDGKFYSGGRDYNAVMVTEGFARSDFTPGPVLVGVAYRDLNKNGVYDPGEGVGDVTVQVSGSQDSALSSRSGG